jgi:putative ABC transport system substrate-binding protein
LRNLRLKIALLTLLSSMMLLGPALAASGKDRATPSPPQPVAIVASADIQAHRVVVEAIRSAFAGSSQQVQLIELGRTTDSAVPSELANLRGVRVIIAIGSAALDYVAASHPEVPVICTMVLRNQPGAARLGMNTAATVSLDVPLIGLLGQLKQVFPEKTRLGIIRNPATHANVAAEQSRALQMGFTVRVLDCATPERLLATFLELKDQVDFVWCLPDGALYNSATIKPLVLASIQNRLPIIGFSEGFVRAGAAVGIYADFYDMGLQTAELAQQLLAGRAIHSGDGPRKLKVAVNRSVTRLLGLRYVALASPEEFVVLQ